MSYLDLLGLATNPPAPPTGYLRLTASTDGNFYLTDDAGLTVGPILFAPMIVPASTELTISSGVIAPGLMYHTVDTESDDASDDLDTITAPSSFPIFNLLILRPTNDARSVVVKHGTGNIILSGGVDITLDDETDHILLFYDGTQWVNLQ